MRALVAAALAGFFVSGVPATMALASDSNEVLVTVNDRPLTAFDVQTRINLWKLLGREAPSNARKVAMDELIDDLAEIEEARKRGMQAKPEDIDKRLESVAKGLKTDNKGLRGRLRAQGISLSSLRLYLEAEIAFNRLIRGQNKEDFTVSEAEVKRRVAAYRAEIDGKINAQIRRIESDPRRRPVTVYSIMEIDFPIEQMEGGVTNEVLQTRAIEVQQYLSRFKGCGSARKAASGIFNVKVGRKVDADASKLPKPLKQELDKRGVGSALGPLRGPNGLQAIAFCGVRKVTPPPIKRPDNIKYPTADQVRSMLEQERYAEIQKKYAGLWRQGVLIEYRDQSQ